MRVDEAGEEETIAGNFYNFCRLPFWFDGLEAFLDKGYDAVFVDADCTIRADFEFGEGLAVHKRSEVDRFRDGG